MVFQKWKKTLYLSWAASNEICYQSDHSYAKNIIDYVNDDCLLEIFTYVPVCERPKIALVCQRWNSLLETSWNSTKKLQLTHRRYSVNPNSWKKFPTLDGQLEFVKSLIDRCGCYLTQADFSAYGQCDILPVIKECCPELVELQLRFTNIDIKDEVLCNAFLGLSKLKVLSIIFQDYAERFVPRELVYSLINVAATLTNLSLVNWEKIKDRCYFSAETIYVFRELKALKRVDISGIFVTRAFHNYLYDNMIVYSLDDAYFRMLDTCQCHNIPIGSLTFSPFIFVSDCKCNKLQIRQN